MNRNMRIGVASPSWLLACLSLLLVGMLSLQSCKKEYFGPDRIKDATWNPELAVPLIKSTVTVPEVLEMVREVYGYEYESRSGGYIVMPARHHIDSELADGEYAIRRLE